ncbi:MAG: fibronectin type III domain-containing protein, partial [Chloroflexi bacterium]|nr:fibronectin type III domain-containing protein [Chloroflexota bacterium]
ANRAFPYEGTYYLTADGTPERPIAIKAAGDGEVTLVWEKPTTDGGSPLSEYLLVVTPGDQVISIPPSLTSFVVTGLTNGVSYSFQMQARNNVGLSSTTLPTPPVTPAATPGAPGAPLNVVASQVPGTAGVLVSWEPPVGDGGNPVTGYVVAVDPPDAGELTVDGTTLSVTFSGLTAGVSYSFTVRAVNAAGPGPRSDPSSPISLAPSPGSEPTPPPAENQPSEPPSVFETTLEVTEEDREILEGSLGALGEGAQVSDAPITVDSTDGRIVVSLPIQVTDPDQPITGELDIEIEGLTLNTVDGIGTGSIDLGAGLTLEGGVELAIESGIVVAELVNPELVYAPGAPAPLEGSDLSHISVEFRVGIAQVPDGASLTVTYARSAAEIAAIAGAVFELAASDGQAIDIAFAVNIARSGISNDNLGSNTAAMSVDRTWYEARLAEGKTIAITKVNDDGTARTVEATCVVSGDVVRCTAVFDGDAGGFSLFALLARSISGSAAGNDPPAGETTPTATPIGGPASESPTPTATPAPTQLPTAIPSSATASPDDSGAGPEVAPTPAAAPTRTPTPSPVPEPVPTPSSDGTATTDGDDSESGGGFPWWAWALIVLVGVPAIIRAGVLVLDARRRTRSA